MNCLSKIDLFIGKLLVFLEGIYSSRRNKYLLSKVKKTGQKIVMHKGIIIHNAENLIIGEGTAFGDNVVIMAYGGITIGDRVLIAHGVSIISVTHDHTLPIMNKEMLYLPVIIEDDVWIGAKAIILPGVTIGAGAVIGASAVVTKSIPANAIAVGNPAKVIFANRFEHKIKNNFGRLKN